MNPFLAVAVVAFTPPLFVSSPGLFVFWPLSSSPYFTFPFISSEAAVHVFRGYEGKYEVDIYCFKDIYPRLLRYSVDYTDKISPTVTFRTFQILT